MRSRARANLAFQLGIGQIGVILNIIRANDAFGVNDYPGARGKGEPVFGSQIGRNARVEDF